MQNSIINRSFFKKCMLGLLILSFVFCLFSFSAYAVDPPESEDSSSTSDFFVIKTNAAGKSKEVGINLNGTIYYYTKDLAKDYGSGSNNYFNSSWSKPVVHMIYYAEGGLFEALTSTDALKINSFSGDNASKLWGIFWTIFDAMKVVGAGLALMWVLLDLIEASSNQMLNGEFVLKIFIKFILAVFIIDYGKNLIESLLAISNGFYDMVAKNIDANTVSESAFTSDVLTTLTKANFMGCIAMLLEYILPALCILVCFVVALTTILGRIFELGVRTAFAPVGIADLMIHGTNSGGMRYAKSFLACATQGAAMILILRIGAELMSGDGLFDFLGKNTPLAGIVAGMHFIVTPLIAITTIGVMKRADSILQNVFS